VSCYLSLSARSPRALTEVSPFSLLSLAFAPVLTHSSTARCLSAQVNTHSLSARSLRALTEYRSLFVCTVLCLARVLATLSLARSHFRCLNYPSIITLSTLGLQHKGPSQCLCLVPPLSTHSIRARGKVIS
jgi:hypothetical protein